MPVDFVIRGERSGNKFPFSCTLLGNSFLILAIFMIFQNVVFALLSLMVSILFYASIFFNRNKKSESIEIYGEILTATRNGVVIFSLNIKKYLNWILIVLRRTLTEGGLWLFFI